MLKKIDYQQFIERAYENEKGRYEAEYAAGLKQIPDSTPLFGYFPPRWMLDFGATCAFLYARKGEARLAEQARDALLFYRAWQQRLPPDAARQRPEYDDGIAPLEPVFHPSIFVLAVQNIRRMLSKEELDNLVEMLAETFRPVWRFPEWGGHNRAMLRAAGLAAGARAFPDHPQAVRWAALADELAEESWGRWSIEDAMLYQPHWLRALIHYASARGRQSELQDMVQPRLYLKAITQLISPLDILPDFGDSHWLMHSHWEWAACLEWGASIYQDPAMKWAAMRIIEGRKDEAPTAYLATVAGMSWKWCNDDLQPRPPINREDALDDLVLKKCVWRTGWDPDSTYACLNYRDEGDYGRVARDYLRTTLAVSAEKMHHGHADEGSFSMLVHDGTLLLHESGYREQPPDGIYRSAVYHNRLVWRNERRVAPLGLLEFLRGEGRYQPVRTERLYQTRVLGADFKRVRVTDENEGLSWDRSVVFLPGWPCWVIIDSVLSARTTMRTLSSLWWTTDILRQGNYWFETHIRGVQEWKNRSESALLVALPDMPSQPCTIMTEPLRRHFQDEVALAQTWCGEHRSGQYRNFVTVLWPHPYQDLDENRPTGIEVVESSLPGCGLGVRLRWKEEEILLGTLNDLNAGFGQEDIRPAYTASRGLVNYGPLSSDAAFAIRIKNAQGERLGFINGTYLAFQGQAAYEGQPHAMFQENGTAIPGVPARFRWEG